jgi:hypothetical protein
MSILPLSPSRHTWTCESDREGLADRQPVPFVGREAFWAGLCSNVRCRIIASTGWNVPVGGARDRRLCRVSNSKSVAVERERESIPTVGPLGRKST